MSKTVSETREARSAALRKLAKEHGVIPAPEPAINTSAEDLHELLDSGRDFGAWVAITQSPETGTHYFYPCITRVGAEARAVENAGDDIFPEVGRAVVNLDTGERINA